MLDMNKKKSEKFFMFFNGAFLILLALICFLPVYHILMLSLSDKSAIAANKVTLWPVGFQLNAYDRILRNLDFIRAFLVSIGRVITGSILNMVVLVLAAYPLSLSSKELKGREALMWLLYVPAFFSGGLIPTYIQMSRLGLTNTPWVLIINNGIFVMGYAILLLNFFRNLPKSLAESASIDGAGHMRILFYIFIPLSKAALATILLFNMVGLWNEWFTATIYLNDRAWYPLQTYLYNRINISYDFTNMTREQIELAATFDSRTLRAAQIFVSTLPIMLVYPFLQKYFMAGIVLGSVKE